MNPISNDPSPPLPRPPPVTTIMPLLPVVPNVHLPLQLEGHNLLQLENDLQSQIPTQPYYYLDTQWYQGPIDTTLDPYQSYYNESDQQYNEHETTPSAPPIPLQQDDYHGYHDNVREPDYTVNSDIQQQHNGYYGYQNQSANGHMVNPNNGGNQEQQGYPDNQHQYDNYHDNQQPVNNGYQNESAKDHMVNPNNGGNHGYTDNQHQQDNYHGNNQQPVNNNNSQPNPRTINGPMPVPPDYGTSVTLPSCPVIQPPIPPPISIIMDIEPNEPADTINTQPAGNSAINDNLMEQMKNERLILEKKEKDMERQREEIVKASEDQRKLTQEQVLYMYILVYMYMYSSYNGHSKLVLLIEVRFVKGSFNTIKYQNGTRKVSLVVRCPLFRTTCIRSSTVYQFIQYTTIVKPHTLLITFPSLIINVTYCIIVSRSKKYLTRNTVN